MDQSLKNGDLILKMEWINRDLCIRFNSNFVKNERDFLREDELMSIEEKQFNIEHLQIVQDLFVFSC